MMKFLNEDNKSTVPDSDGFSAGDNNASSKIEPQEEGYLTPATKEKSIKRGTILLAVVFTAGLLSLLVMIKKTGPSPAAAQAATEDTRIEAAISKLTGIKTQFLNRMDQIVKKFHDFSSVEQVEVYELQKNPFVYERYLESLSEQAALEDDLESSSNKTALIQSKLLRRAEKMQLLSIMETSTGRCCMIDDLIVSPGDYVNGFQVVAIGSYSVELRAEGMKFVLRIPSE